MVATTPVWLITGSSSGLGLALTRYAQSQGHTVVATSRNPSKTPDLVAEVESHGGKWLRLDVTSPDSEIKAVVRQAESLFGRIDVVVNNAGYAVMGAVEDVPESETAAQMEANFSGPLRIMQAVLPDMRKRRSGVIMNVSSTQGLCPSPACGVYAASKAALEAVSESCSAEVAPFGIRILIVEPGAFRTNFSGANAARYVQPSEDYAVAGHPVATRLAHVKTLGGAAIGDPAKAARVMLEAATGSGEVGPLIKDARLLRLVIGPDSWKRVDEKVSELRRTADLLKDVAASTSL